MERLPKIGDITEFGTVKSVENIDGIAIVVMRDKMRFIWLSDERVANLPDDYGEPKSHWADIQDLDYLLEHYDYEYAESGQIIPKSLRHAQIAWDCKIEVILRCGNVSTWNASVDGDGNIDCIMPTVEGYPKKITTLDELRATGITDASLISQYSIINF